MNILSMQMYLFRTCALKEWRQTRENLKSPLRFLKKAENSVFFLSHVQRPSVFFLLKGVLYNVPRRKTSNMMLLRSSMSHIWWQHTSTQHTVRSKQAIGRSIRARHMFDKWYSMFNMITTTDEPDKSMTFWEAKGNVLIKVMKLFQEQSMNYSLLYDHT